MAAKQRVQEEALHGAALVEAIRESPYVQRLLADEDLRSNLQEAIESGKSAYDRAAKKRRGGAKKLIQDQKLQNDLKAHAADITALLRRNLAQADSLGLQGTPTYLVGPFRTSTLDYAGFKQVVSDARKKQAAGQ